MDRFVCVKKVRIRFLFFVFLEHEEKYSLSYLYVIFFFFFSLERIIIRSILFFPFLWFVSWFVSSLFVCQGRELFIRFVLIIVIISSIRFFLIV